MKEDKENTRPKERKLEIKYEDDGEKAEKTKEKKEAMTKVKAASSLAASATTRRLCDCVGQKSNHQQEKRPSKNIRSARL